MSTRRTGLAMIVLAWLVVGGLLVLMFTRVLEDRENPNRNPATRIDGSQIEVTLRRNRAGHFVANGEINGADAVFLLDTGATDVVVSAELATRAGLKRLRAARASTAAGTISVFDTRIDRVALGDIVLRDVNASINPHMQGRDVLLGMSFLGQLELTQRDGTLTLRHAE